MGAQLIVLAGGDEGACYPLEESLLVGSAPECQLLVPPEEGSSERQAELVEYLGRYVLSNLDRSRVVKVNDRSIVRQPLVHGDVLLIGGIVLLFDEGREPEGEDPQPPQRSSPTDSSLETVPDDPRNISIAGRQTAFDDVHSVVQTLREDRQGHSRLPVLFEVTAAISQVLDLVPMLDRLLGVVCEEFKADLGSIWLLNDGRWQVQSAWRRGEGKVRGEICISRTLLKEVIRTGEGVLTVDAMDDDRFLSGQSIIDQKIRSALYVPIAEKGELLGMIQLSLHSPHRGYSKHDLQLLLAIAMQTAVSVQNARLVQVARVSERLQHELELAASIQSDLLPRRVPEISGIELAGGTIAALEMGGDYYDFVLSGRGRMLDIVIGDVVGKGISAGLVMVMARSFLLPLLAAGGNTQEVIVRLNELLVRNTKPSIFMSLLLLRWDADRKELRYTGAGHEHLLLYRASEGRTRAIRSGGVALGLSERTADAYCEKRIPFEVGDQLVLYTDGITEALDEHTRQFGLNRLLRLLNRQGLCSPSEVLDAIEEDVGRFRGQAEPSDDRTLVALRRTC